MAAATTPDPSRRAVRQEIISKFKSIFEAHEEENGIPKECLRQHIINKTSISARRVLSILDEADDNMDGRITITEFVHQLSREDSVTLRRLAAPKRFLNHAVRMVAPRRSYVPTSVLDEYIFQHWGEDEDIDNFVQAYTCTPPPIFIPVISIVQIAIFAFYASTSHSASFAVPVNSTLVYHPDRRQEVWRFVTYMFLHGNVRHLVFNLVYQLILGLLLELVHKGLRIGIIYMLGVLTGSLIHAIFVDKALVGASGGCYALIGAHVANVMINWKEMQVDWKESVLKFISSAVLRVSILTMAGLLDIGLMIVDSYDSQKKSSISISAHVGGFLAGLLIGVAVLRNLDIKAWEKILFLTSTSVYIVFMTVIIIVNAVV